MKNIVTAIAKKELTLLEGQAMNWLLTTGYYAETHFSDVDFKELAEGLKWDFPKTKGVVGSLVNKEYLYTDNDTGYHIIYATKKGYELDDNFHEKWEECGNW